MTATARSANRIALWLARHGVAVERSSSSLSASVYLRAASDHGVIRIRISDHVARPTYEALNGAADIEVGAHDGAPAGDEADATMRALTHLAVAPDARLVALIGRRDRAQAARDHRRRAESAASAAALNSAVSAFEAECIRRYPKYAEYLGRTNKGAKEGRRLIRRRVEAEMGVEKWDGLGGRAGL